MAKVYRGRKNHLIIFAGTLRLLSKDLEMKIKAPAETWWDLLDVDFEDPSLLSDAFYKGVIQEVIKFLKSKKARGIHAERVDFTRTMKRYCAYIYCLCEYWLRRPRDKWPHPIKEAVDLLETPIHKRSEEISRIAGSLTLFFDHTQTIKKPNASILTALFAENNFHKERIRSHFDKWTDNLETFRRTFVTNNKRYIKHYKNKILPLLFRRFGNCKENLPFNTGDLPEIYAGMRKSFTNP